MRRRRRGKRAFRRRFIRGRRRRGGRRSRRLRPLRVGYRM